MRITRAAVVSALAGVAALLASQFSVVRANSSFAGNWEGKMNDLPGLDLTIEEHDGKISGHIVFYYQERSDPNGPWHTAAEYPASLLAPHVEGKVLTFEVEHHKCHACAELGPNAKFRVELIAQNEARLWKLDDEAKSSDPGMKLVRKTDSPSTSVVQRSPADAQSPRAASASSFVGTWNGKQSDGAGLDLKIDEDDGKSAGFALLYSQVGGPLPLLTPHVDGKTLTFELQRHKCSQCEELGPNAKFLMERTGANEASLWMLDEKNNRSGAEVKLARQTDSAAWHDPSPHQVQFIIVEYNVRLEVLDWGGTGPPVVLLAGSGNTAHVFDDFAPKLAAFGHVYGITRRGYGESSHPDAGYTEERLAQDVLQVVDSLTLVKPVIVGHSAGGEELTRLGDDHSDRLGGLVYIDAAFDPADYPASNPDYMKLYQNLPAPMRDHHGPSDADRRSFEAYREWQERNGGAPFPEPELRNQFETKPDGSIGAYKASTSFIHNAIGEGALKRDYSKIRVPILAFFGMRCSEHTQANYACIEHPPHKAEYEPKSAQERAAKEAFDSATAAYVSRWEKNLQNAPGGVRTVDLPGSNHYMFLSNEADVLREIRAFLLGLH
jgi:non-heme chloroperoxidase